MIRLELPDTFIELFYGFGSQEAVILYPGVAKWCQEHLTDWKVEIAEVPYLVCSETEAVMFKLRWADQFAGEELPMSDQQDVEYVPPSEEEIEAWLVEQLEDGED